MVAAYGSGLVLILIVVDNRLALTCSSWIEFLRIVLILIVVDNRLAPELT